MTKLDTENLVVTLSDIEKEISSYTGYPYNQVHDITGMMIDIINDHLVKGEEVRIRNLGKFYFNIYPERKVRSNLSGKMQTIPPRILTKCKVSEALQNRIEKNDWSKQAIKEYFEE